jgi:Carboxypeptidase regulatory-like domain
VRVSIANSVTVLGLVCAGSMLAQSLGNTGTVEGTVVDPSGAAIPGAQVTLHNPLSNYTQSASSGSDGSFRIGNVPPNTYHMEVTAPGFEQFAQDVAVRNSLPVQVKATLAVDRPALPEETRHSGSAIVA